jgi:transposase-like protein
MDLTATQSAKITWIERKTVNNWYNYIRQAIKWYEEREQDEVLNWVIELDESYFWPTRIKWKRWRWAWMKTIVFGLLKRNWKVYSKIIPDVKAKTLMPIIRWKVEDWSEINTDWWKAYDGLVDIWFDKHYRVHHWETEFARWKQHINCIESFWSYAKRRLAKFNWITRQKFELHLKETEFRFNCWLAKKNLYNELKRVVKLYRKIST